MGSNEWPASMGGTVGGEKENTVEGPGKSLHDDVNDSSQGRRHSEP